jgi:regulator of extracellular matrix RemA (YlzA/DUF370 family)
LSNQYKLINIGFGNIVLANRIVALVSNDSAPIKRIIQEAREKGMLIDATYGRRTRAVIITDSGYIVLSSIHPETVANRIVSKENGEPPGGYPGSSEPEHFLAEEDAAEKDPIQKDPIQKDLIQKDPIQKDPIQKDKTEND